jgi:hypothetical protein
MKGHKRTVGPKWCCAVARDLQEDNRVHRVDSLYEMLAQ